MTENGGVTLRDHLTEMVAELRVHMMAMIVAAESKNDTRFDALAMAVTTAMTAAEKAVTTAMSAAEKAVIKAEAAAEKRFEAVNEFRQSLNDITTTLMPRAESDAKFLSILEKIDSMQRMFDKHQGEGSGVRQGWGYIAGVVGVISLIASLFLKP